MLFFLKKIFKQVCPPILWSFLKKFILTGKLLFPQVKRSVEKEKLSNSLNSNKRTACHFFEPFVSHSGDIFPCCRVWSDPAKKIGHITEPNIVTKMKEFEIDCQCEVTRLKKWEGEDVGCIYFETSLACNAACAMCCVHAPLWRGKYDCYDALTTFASQLNAQKISVQGGECLAQPQTLQWLDGIRNEYPEIKIHLITNGNALESIYGKVKRIFTSITVSIVGFQDPTYRIIMNIDFSKTKSFITMILTETSIPLSLKFLITPINIHEVDLFMDWAVEQQSDSIQLIEAYPLVDAICFENSIPFWETIIARSGNNIRASLKRHAITLSARKCKVYCSRFVVDHLKVTPEFAAEIGLSTYTPYA